MEDTVVLKFDSSVLRRREDLPTAVHEIYRWYRSGLRVVAIVSAIGDQTETLLAEARSLADDPDSQATAELLATGERHSAALLGIALDRAGPRRRSQRYRTHRRRQSARQRTRRRRPRSS